MLIVRDVTELRGLQAEAQNQKRELEIIGQILAVPRKNFMEFLESTFGFIRQNRELIQQSKEKDTNVINTLFRNMHTVKGNARTYGFDYLTDTVHEVEQRYDQLRKEVETPWNRDLLLLDLERAQTTVEQYKHLNDEKLLSNEDTMSDERQVLHRIGQMIQNMDLSLKQNQYDFADKVAEALNAL